MNDKEKLMELIKNMTDLDIHRLMVMARTLDTIRKETK